MPDAQALEGKHDSFRRMQPHRTQGMVGTIRQLPLVPMAILAVFLICGVFGSLITPHDPNKIRLLDSLRPPFWEEGGTTKYPLGTDQAGRDIFSRLIAGASVSLVVGFTVVVLCGMFGTAVGIVSGYLGGWVDMVLMRVADIFLSMPLLVIAIVMAAVLGPNTGNLILILAILGWASYARVMRGEVLRIKGGDFISLAEVAGAGKVTIMWRHIFPNVINTLVILSTLSLGMVIIAESSLSFLGLGVPPPAAAWGSMAADGRNHIFDAWWICAWPGVAILLVVLSCNLLGDWLRVRLDPKFRQL